MVVLEHVWEIRQFTHPSYKLTKQQLPLKDGDTVIGTYPSELWRVTLKFEEEDLGGLVMTASG